MKSFPLSLQEIFDIAVASVIAQGEPCVNETGKCVYTGPNGDHCAAGWVFAHLDDEELNATMDAADTEYGGVSASNVASDAGYALDHQQRQLLGELQSAHDLTTERSFGYFIDQAAKLGGAYDLNLNAIMAGGLGFVPTRD